MTTVDEPREANQAQFPFVHFEDLNHSTPVEPLSHFVNFDRLLVDLPLYFGDAFGPRVLADDPDGVRSEPCSRRRNFSPAAPVIPAEPDP